MSAIFDLAKSVQLTQSELEERALAHLHFLRDRSAGGSEQTHHESPGSDFQTAVLGALVRTVDGDLEEGEEADQTEQSNPGGSSNSYGGRRNFRVGSIVGVLDLSPKAEEGDLLTECCFSVEYGDKREGVVELRSVSLRPMERHEHEFYASQCARFQFGGGAAERGAQQPAGSSRLFLSTEELLAVRQRLSRWTAGGATYAVKRSLSSQKQNGASSQLLGIATGGSAAPGSRDDIIKTLLQSKNQLQQEIRMKDEVIRVQALKKHQDQESSHTTTNNKIQELQEKIDSLVADVKGKDEANAKAKSALAATSRKLNESMQLEVAVKALLRQKGVKAQGSGKNGTFTTADLIQHIESL